jgi:hypothetical protein
MRKALLLVFKGENMERNILSIDYSDDRLLRKLAA